MAATGLTGAHVMDLGDGDVPQLLASVEYEAVLPLRLRLAPWCMPGVDKAGPGRADRAPAARPGGTGGSAGSSSSWTAPSRAAPPGWSTPTATARAPTRSGRTRRRTRTRYGTWTRPASRTATHAIGDAAVRHVLDTVESLGGSGRGVHRIEHIETVPDDTIPRFAALGVAASMQPPHTAYTRGRPQRRVVEAARRRTGPRAPGAAGTCGTRARSSPWARTGRSPTTTPARSCPWPASREGGRRARAGADRAHGAGGLHLARGARRR